MPTNALFTGATRDGGYASHVVADAHYCFDLPERFSDVEAAPFLCAGLIGRRALRLAGAAPVISFFEAIGSIDLHTVTQSFRLEDANEALQSLRSGKVKGAAVLLP